MDNIFMSKMGFVQKDAYINVPFDDRYGCIGIDTVTVDETDFDNYITEIVLNWDNLKFIFLRNTLNRDIEFLLLNRFLPSIKPDNIREFVHKSLSDNHNFYSFLSEVLMSLILRDVYGYNLSVAVLATDETIADGHTGVDACLYDQPKNKIVIGEAKFYKKISDAISTIKADFISNNKIKNKLESLYKKALSNPASKSIILYKIGDKSIAELSLTDFLKIDLIFAGFILYEKKRDITAKDYCDMCAFNSKDIELNVSTKFSLPLNHNYSLIMIKLPIQSKEELITKTIEKAYSIKEGL